MPSAHTRTALTATQIIAGLAKTEGWKLYGDGADIAIEKTYRFESFLKTMAFVNAIAYIAERQDHHPELQLTFGSCSVRFNTHDVQGVSKSDFECAALVDALVRTTPNSTDTPA